MGLSSYTKGKKLGAGSFGTVYAATHNATRDAVVLKEVNLRGCPHDEQQNALKEAPPARRHPTLDGAVPSQRGGAAEARWGSAAMRWGRGRVLTPLRETLSEHDR